MINEINQRKVPVKITRNDKSPEVKTLKAAAPPSASSAVPRSAALLVAAAGLPSDKLSASIVSFARFFSLPLKPDILAEIRRQAFAGTPVENQRNDAAEKSAPGRGEFSDAVAKNRQALALAAAAAESKGVELQQKALESFSEAIDPDWRRRRDDGGRERERRDKDKWQKEESNQFKLEALSASSLKKNAVEFAEKNPCLNVLNRLPDKDGRRWIVLPFYFSENGVEARVSMRILLEKKQNRACQMALDVADINSGEKSWLFSFEASGNQISRLSVFIKQDLSLKERLALGLKLSRLIGIPSERVSVKKRDDDFPSESCLERDLLPAINEAV